MIACVSADVTVLGLVGGAPAQGWGGDTACRRFIGGGRGPLLHGEIKASDCKILASQQAATLFRPSIRCQTQLVIAICAIVTQHTQPSRVFSIAAVSRRAAADIRAVTW